MMKTKLYIFLFTFLVVSVSFAQKPNCTRIYKYVCTRNANGDIMEDGYGPKKIMICAMSNNFFGISTCSCVYNEENVAGIWPSVGQDYEYAGYNNGWYIFKQYLGMFGTNLIYLESNYERVRVKLVPYKGTYREYVPWKESDEIDYSPTK